MIFQGGCGTNFDIAVGAFSRRVENKIIFTAGEASMPDIQFDAIWIVFSNKKISQKVEKLFILIKSNLQKYISIKKI